MLMQTDDLRWAEIEQRLDLIEEMLGLKNAMHFPPSAGLSKTQEKLVKMLIATPRLTQEAAMAGLYGDREGLSSNLLSVHITNIRRSLAAMQITVRTVRGVGWEVDELDRAKLRGMLR